MASVHRKPINPVAVIGGGSLILGYLSVVPGLVDSIFDAPSYARTQISILGFVVLMILISLVYLNNIQVLVEDGRK